MPFILLNAKNYPTGIGKSLLNTLSSLVKVQKQSGQKLSIAINALDIFVACEQFGSELDIFAQHCDGVDFGAFTGNIVPQYLKEMGVKGVILNHSEKRFSSETLLYAAIAKAKSAGLLVVCCSESVLEGGKIACNTTADYIAIEPPELIGGKISVSKARPEIIAESVQAIGAGRVLVGAGIGNAEDINIVMKHGGSGVLLSSSVMKAENIENALYTLLPF